MPKNSEQPASWRAFTKPRRAQPEEPVVLDFGARAQDFLKRITTLSADLAAHGRTRALALQKLHRLCQAEVRQAQSPVHPCHRQARPLQVSQRDPRRGARSLGLAPKENALRSALQLLALDPEETRALNAAYHQ